MFCLQRSIGVKSGIAWDGSCMLGLINEVLELSIQSRIRKCGVEVAVSNNVEAGS